MITKFQLFESIENWKPKYKVGDYVLVPRNSWGPLPPELDFERDQVMIVTNVDKMDQEYSLDFVIDGKDPELYGNIFDEDDIIQKLNKKEVKFFLEDERRPRKQIFSDEDPYGEEMWESVKEPEKLKVGDYVLFIDDKKIHIGSSMKDRLHGKIGKIISTSFHSGYFNVEFLDDVGGHSCKGKGKSGHCCLVDDRYLKKIDSRDISGV